MIFINFEVICGDRSKIIKIFDFVIIFRMGKTEKFINIILIKNQRIKKGGEKENAKRKESKRKAEAE